MFYAGITKILNPEWSSAGYLNAAKTFPELYQWLASSEIISITNFFNEWGLTLLGASLILGVGVRLSAPLGALLMLLYYFPVLEFPYIAGNSFIVDEHIIYVVALLVLAATHGSRILSLEGKIPILNRLFK